MGRDDTDTYCGRIEVLYPELELVVSIVSRGYFLESATFRLDISALGGI
jgi:hypothetical protein